MASIPVNTIRRYGYSIINDEIVGALRGSDLSDLFVIPVNNNSPRDAYRLVSRRDSEIPGYPVFYKLARLNGSEKYEYEFEIPERFLISVLRFGNFRLSRYAMPKIETPKIETPDETEKWLNQIVKNMFTRDTLNRLGLNKPNDSPPETIANFPTFLTYEWFPKGYVAVGRMHDPLRYWRMFPNVGVDLAAPDTRDQTVAQTLEVDSASTDVNWREQGASAAPENAAEKPDEPTYVEVVAALLVACSSRSGVYLSYSEINGMSDDMARALYKRLGLGR